MFGDVVRLLCPLESLACCSLGSPALGDTFYLFQILTFRLVQYRPFPPGYASPFWCNFVSVCCTKAHLSRPESVHEPSLVPR